MPALNMLLAKWQIGSWNHFIPLFRTSFRRLDGYYAGSGSCFRFGLAQESGIGFDGGRWLLAQAAGEARASAGGKNSPRPVVY